MSAVYHRVELGETAARTEVEDPTLVAHTSRFSEITRTARPFALPVPNGKLDTMLLNGPPLYGVPGIPGNSGPPHL